MSGLEAAKLVCKLRPINIFTFHFALQRAFNQQQATLQQRRQPHPINNTRRGGGRLLPNAGPDWLPKAGAGLKDLKPRGVAANPPLGPRDPKPLETGGAAPYPLGALAAPNENTGWAAVGAGALAA